MDISHVAIGLAGAFIGSFLMTVWHNERWHRRNREAVEMYRQMYIRGRWFPPSTQPPPPPPQAPPKADK
jgi:hypothetical protein